MKNKILWIIILLSLKSSLLLAEDPPGQPQVKTEEQIKISLDIKGMDIVDVLKMLASRSDMNIVVGKNVTGRVTLFLKDVLVKDAFEIILLANELAYEQKGDIINVMTQRDYELRYGQRFQEEKLARVIQLKYAKAIDLSRSLNQIKSNVGKIVVDEGSNTVAIIDIPQKTAEMEDFIKNTDLPIQTKIFSLNYAQADKIQAKIQETLTKGVGYVRVDERTNKVAVTDYPEKLKEITEVITEFDEKTPQVLIDAQIIEIRPKDEYKMGINWDYWLQKNVRLAESLASTTTSNTIKVGTAARGENVDQAGEYKGVIDLLRTIGDTKILSSPRITALNNQEAKILIGTKEVYVSQTTSQSGAGTEVTSDQVNFVDVGIKLYVTPTINNDGFITMKIRPEVSSVKEKYQYGTPTKEIPVVETSEAETTVMIKDGVTVIIGGLKKDKRTKYIDKIPYVSDIPIIGAFFRRTSDSTEKTELVILLTPHLLSGAESLTNFANIKPIDGAVAQMHEGEIILEQSKSTRESAPKENEKGMDYSKISDSEYYKLVTNWVRAKAYDEWPRDQKGKVIVAFTLSKDGKVINRPYILETTNPVLNKYALKAVNTAVPFPAFPASIKNDKETFRIILSYE